MKKIVANMTMGNDMSPLFPDILNVMQVPVLEIKKMVYLYIINYARTKPDMAVMAISMFIKVYINILPPFIYTWAISHPFYFI